MGFGFLDELDKIEVFVQRFDTILITYCYRCIALPATSERNGKKSDTKLKDLSVAVIAARLSLVSGCGSLVTICLFLGFVGSDIATSEGRGTLESTHLQIRYSFWD